jgi:type II secretory pathway pseudopilin PulG
MMTPRRTFEIVAVLVVTTLAAMAFHAWLASHDEQLRMQATLAAQKQIIEAADARERNRAGTLDQTLAGIEKLKREVRTPQQILRALPKYLPLPQPITLAPSPDAGRSHSTVGLSQIRKGTGPSPNPVNADPNDRVAGTPAPEQDIEPLPASPDGQHNSSSLEGSGVQGLPDAANRSTPHSDVAQIPVGDLKPLYDYVQDCRTCQAQLADAKQNRADDAAKLAAMTRERDSAITAAKGGTFWRRFRRNVEWFALGAGAGAAAVCGSGHCR